MSAPERIWVDPDEAKYFDGSGANQVAEYVRADLYAELEQERDRKQANAVDWHNEAIDRGREVERLRAEQETRMSIPDVDLSGKWVKRELYERLRAIVEMAWAGYGYDQEWECDCQVCAAIRTRTPHDTGGGW